MTSQTPQNSPRRPFHDPQTQQAAGKLNQPQTRYPARPATSQPATSDRTGYLASSAAGPCIKDAKAAVKNTAARPAGRQHIENGGASGQNDRRYGSMETQQTTRNSDQWYDPSGRVRTCDHCGREYVAKRSTSRYCASKCRVAAYKKRRKS